MDNWDGYECSEADECGCPDCRGPTMAARRSSWQIFEHMSDKDRLHEEFASDPENVAA